jgi:hypothetical protein
VKHDRPVLCLELLDELARRIRHPDPVHQKKPSAFVL